MTTEEIITQAEAYADWIEDGNRIARQCAIKAYKQGYNDCIKNHKAEIWHPADELPDCSDKGIIIVTRVRRRFIHASFNGENEWRNKIRQVNALQWAYKHELL